MPQLMPLFWYLSLFMIMYIILVMGLVYFVKLLDYDMVYLNVNDNLMNNKYLFMLFKW